MGGKVFRDRKKVLKEENELFILGKIGSGGFLKYERIISRNMFKQEEWMSCAASCVKQIGKDLNIHLSESLIRKEINTTFRGTDARDLYEGIKRIFKENKVIGQVWYKPDVDDLSMFSSRIKEIEGSFITNIGLGNNKHAIIVDKVVGSKVHIRDPWPLEVDLAYKKGIRGQELEKIFNKSTSGIEAIADLKEFVREWAKGGNLIIKIE